MCEFLYGRRDGVSLSALTDLIGLLANPNESARDNMPPLRPTPISKMIDDFESRFQHLSYDLRDT